MSYELAERNGSIYVKETTTDFFEPRFIIHYWPVGLRYAEFVQWFASHELAQKAIGDKLHSTIVGVYKDERGWTYRLPDGGKTTPEHTDLEPIPEPAQRGRKLPMVWRNGQWYKRTAKGLVTA